jgi:hypothetical protein
MEVYLEPSAHHSCNLGIFGRRVDGSKNVLRQVFGGIFRQQSAN